MPTNAKPRLAIVIKGGTVQAAIVEGQDKNDLVSIEYDDGETELVDVSTALIQPAEEVDIDLVSLSEAIEEAIRSHPGGRGPCELRLVYRENVARIVRGAADRLSGTRNGVHQSALRAGHGYSASPEVASERPQTARVVLDGNTASF